MLDDNGMETSLDFGRGMFCSERKMPASLELRSDCGHLFFTEEGEERTQRNGCIRSPSQILFLLMHELSASPTYVGTHCV